MNIKNNIENLLKEIPDNVKLVAVSKTKSNENILEAYNAGLRIFGENKVQELSEKHPRLPEDIQWHFIGHLQSNKVKYIAPYISMLHAIDSLKLLKVVYKEGVKNNRLINCLLQIYIAEEETKFGLTYKQIIDLLQNPDFKELQKKSQKNNAGFQISGLMGMATYTNDSEKIKQEFQQLKQYFDKIRTNYQSENQHFMELSMGMSNDYQLAIEQGSTMIRVGTSIFGARNYCKKK